MTNVTCWQNGEVCSSRGGAVGGGVGQCATVDVSGGVLSDEGWHPHILGYWHWRGKFVGDRWGWVHIYTGYIHGISCIKCLCILNVLKNNMNYEIKRYFHKKISITRVKLSKKQRVVVAAASRKCIGIIVMIY